MQTQREKDNQGHNEGEEDEASGLSDSDYKFSSEEYDVDEENEGAQVGDDNKETNDIGANDIGTGCGELDAEPAENIAPSAAQDGICRPPDICEIESEYAESDELQSGSSTDEELVGPKKPMYA